MGGMRTWVELVADVLLQRLRVRNLLSQSHTAVCASCYRVHAIVTGPTSGIGKAIATALALRGATVVLACRSVDRGFATRRDILAKCPSSEQVDVRVLQCDMSSIQSVSAFSDAANASLNQRVDLLVSNAGIFSMNEREPSFTPDGLESHWATNFITPAMLLLKLLPSMHQTPALHGGCRSRAVFVSSKLARLGQVHFDDPSFVSIQRRRSYTPLKAYAQSKLAEEMFADALSNVLSKSATRPTAPLIMTVHPGNVLTSVVRTLPRPVQLAYQLIMQYVLLTPEEGARAPLYCATRGEAASECDQASLRGAFDSSCKPLKQQVHSLSKESADGAQVFQLLHRDAKLQHDALQQLTHGAISSKL